MIFSDRQLLVLGGIAVVGGYLVYRKGAEVVTDVAQAVNPTNHDNVFNTGFNSVYQWATGSKGTLGTDLADFVDNPRLFDKPRQSDPLRNGGATGSW